MNKTPAAPDKFPRRIADKRYRLTADSLKELRRGLTRETDRIIDLGWDWEGGIEGAPKTLRPAHLMNALATWFLGRSLDERTAILQEGLTLYIRRLDGDPAAQFESIDRGPAKVRGAGGYSSQDGGNAPNPKGSNFKAKPQD